MNDKLFIDHVNYLKHKVDNVNIYPFNIKVIENFESLKFNKSVTFLVGDNGIGKSTFIEALAICCGMNPEGGTNNFMFSTRETHSVLHEYFETNYIQRRVKTKFFLRAETFYNVASQIDELDVSVYYGGSLHDCSHGESFLQLFKERFSEDGLYILDEPEAALSPQSQMGLLCLIDELAKKGSQFIIATHSPILISYRGGEILDLNNNFEKIKYEDTEIYKTYKMYLDDPYGMQRRLFDDI